MYMLHRIIERDDDCLVRLHTSMDDEREDEDPESPLLLTVGLRSSLLSSQIASPPGAVISS